MPIKKGNVRLTFTLDNDTYLKFKSIAFDLRVRQPTKVIKQLIDDYLKNNTKC